MFSHCSFFLPFFLSIEWIGRNFWYSHEWKNFFCTFQKVFRRCAIKKCFKVVKVLEAILYYSNGSEKCLSWFEQHATVLSSEPTTVHRPADANAASFCAHAIKSRSTADGLPIMSIPNFDKSYLQGDHKNSHHGCFAVLSLLLLLLLVLPIL